LNLAGKLSEEERGGTRQKYRRKVPGAVLGTYFLKKFNRYPSTNERSLLHCTPDCWEESLPTRWSKAQLVGRDPSQKSGVYASLSEGIPPEKMVYNLSCLEIALPVSCSQQL
jgi:hypothetical protein